MPALVGSTRCNGPTASPANVDSIRQNASAIAELFTVRLPEIKVIAAAWGFDRWTLRDGIVTAQSLEGCNAVRAAGMAVEVNDKETTTAKLNTRHCLREGFPPFGDLLGIRYCGFAPAFDGGPLVQLLRGLIPRHDGGKNKKPGASERKRNV
jgi:hypothetical protein